MSGTRIAQPSARNSLACGAAIAGCVPISTFSHALTRGKGCYLDCCGPFSMSVVAMSCPAGEAMGCASDGNRCAPETARTTLIAVNPSRTRRCRRPAGSTQHKHSWTRLRAQPAYLGADS